MYKIAIIGADGINDDTFCTQKTINIIKNKAAQPEGITLFTIGDDFVTSFANRFHIDTRTFFADFKRYSKNALKMRNNELLSECDALIMFNDGKKDTEVIYNMAVSKGIPTRKVTKP